MYCRPNLPNTSSNDPLAEMQRNTMSPQTNEIVQQMNPLNNYYDGFVNECGLYIMVWLAGPELVHCWTKDVMSGWLAFFRLMEGEGAGVGYFDMLSVGIGIWPVNRFVYSGRTAAPEGVRR